MLEAIRAVLSDPWFLILWGSQAVVAVVWLLIDIATRNREQMSVMKLVWLLTVIYSGLLGLAIYFYSGRKQIRRDSIWRKGFRSVSHCYSGCGMGEVAGILITVGILSLSNVWVATITFTLAYVAGFALTMLPLMQDGESFGQALKDALYSESASITVMEIVAIGVDLWLAGEAGIGEPLFWSSLIVSLSLGLVAAFPVNVLLIKWGVKAGMHDPRHMGHAQHQHAHHGHEGGGHQGHPQHA